MPKKTKKPTILSKQELMEQLYDLLMGQIEPDLMKENQEWTAAFLATLSAEDQLEKLEYYHLAYQEFLDHWPDFIGQVIGNLEESHQAYQDFAKNRETDILSDIEIEITNTDDGN